MTTDQQTAETIDCTPTWEAVCNWYLAVLTDGSIKTRVAKDIAKKEMLRMARLADKYGELVKAYNELLAEVQPPEPDQQVS